MARKKAVAKPNKGDADWEFRESVLKRLDDLPLFIGVAIIGICLMGIFTLTMVLPAIYNLDVKLDKLDAQQEAIATHVALLEDNAVAQELPFCYGYDAAGNKGWGMDVSKITKQCEVPQ